MKRFIVTLLCAFLSLGMFSYSYSLGCRADGIPLEGGGSGSNEEGNDPQGHSLIPISCEYSSISSALVFYFYTDIGLVSIVVTNLVTGECESGTVNSQFGVVSFPITGGSGRYQLSISTQNGETYNGWFVL